MLSQTAVTYSNNILSGIKRRFSTNELRRFSLSQIRSKNKAKQSSQAQEPQTQQQTAPMRYIPLDLDELLQITNFTKQELKDMYRNFKDECPNGVANEKTFKSMYDSIFPHGDSKRFAHYLFRAFDVNDDGQLTFEDFVCELSNILHGSREQRLVWLFRLYDVNDDGEISREEISLIMDSLRKMVGGDRVYRDDSMGGLPADEIFDKFPTNPHGGIDMQGFCDTCSQDAAVMMSVTLFEESI